MPREDSKTLMSFMSRPRMLLMSEGVGAAAVLSATIVTVRAVEMCLVKENINESRLVLRKTVVIKSRPEGVIAIHIYTILV